MRGSDEPIIPGHPRWEEFVDRLTGPEGVNLCDDRWTCHGDLDFSQAILARMGLTQAAIRRNIGYFKLHGGYCDCEVLMNVDRPRNALADAVPRSSA